MVVIDEAAQAVEPATLVPLVMGCKQVCFVCVCVCVCWGGGGKGDLLSCPLWALPAIGLPSALSLA